MSEVSFLQSIAGDIESIRIWVLVLAASVAALVGILIFAIFKITSSISALQPDAMVDGMETESLQMRIEEALAKGHGDEALRLSEQMLLDRPNHIQANWYAAVALYRLGRVHEATRRFDNVVEIAPEWEPTVEAYLERLRSKASASRPSLVKPSEPSD